MPILLSVDTLSLFEITARGMFASLAVSRRQELIAAGFGFNTYNALLAKLRRELRFLAEIDNQRALARLAEFQPDHRRSDDLMAILADSVLGHQFVKNVKLLPIGAGYYGDGERATHLYPPSLAREFPLKEYRKIWEMREAMDRTNAFLPPVPSASDFNQGRFTSFEIYRSWRPGKVRRPLAEETMGVIIHGSDGAPCGYVKWHWWGHAAKFSGADFSLGRIHEGVWYGFSFDLRPNNPLPDNTPIMKDWKLLPPEVWISEIREIGAEWYGGRDIFGKSIYVDEDAE